MNNYREPLEACITCTNASQENYSYNHKTLIYCSIQDIYIGIKLTCRWYQPDTSKRKVLLYYGISWVTHLYPITYLLFYPKGKIKRKEYSTGKFLIRGKKIIKITSITANKRKEREKNKIVTVTPIAARIEGRIEESWIKNSQLIISRKEQIRR